MTTSSYADFTQPPRQALRWMGDNMRAGEHYLSHEDYPSLGLPKCDKRTIISISTYPIPSSNTTYPLCGPVSFGKNIELSLVIFQCTMTLSAVPLRFTGKLRKVEEGPAGSWTVTVWWKVENPISPLASFDVTLRKIVDLSPSLGDEGITWLVNGEADGEK